MSERPLVPRQICCYSILYHWKRTVSKTHLSIHYVFCIDFVCRIFSSKNDKALQPIYKYLHTQWILSTKGGALLSMGLHCIVMWWAFFQQWETNFTCIANMCNGIKMVLTKMSMRGQRIIYIYIYIYMVYKKFFATDHPSFLEDKKLFPPWAMRKMMRRLFDSMAAKLASTLPPSACTSPPASSSCCRRSPLPSRSCHCTGGQGRGGGERLSRQVVELCWSAPALARTPSPALTSLQS